jgi:hypothetical protein
VHELCLDCPSLRLISSMKSPAPLARTLVVLVCLVREGASWMTLQTSPALARARSGLLRRLQPPARPLCTHRERVMCELTFQLACARSSDCDSATMQHGDGFRAYRAARRARREGTGKGPHVRVQVAQRAEKDDAQSGRADMKSLRPVEVTPQLEAVQVGNKTCTVVGCRDE